MLKRKLTIPEQVDILSGLFGFELKGVNKEDENDVQWVLIDDEGDEFNSSPQNINCDFTTLEGIFAYAVNRAKHQGYADCQHAMRKLLDID